MKTLTLSEITRAIQEHPLVDYRGDLDGRYGPATATAVLQALDRAQDSGTPPFPRSDDKIPAPIVIQGAVDERSEGNIKTLHPRVQPLARALITELASQGITAKVISGLRTYEQQDALYEQGRSKGGRIVTNARGGFSNHNFGIAFDIGIFLNGKYADDMAESGQIKYGELNKMYAAAGAIGNSLGLEWGGSWTSFTDAPHFQLRPRWAKDLSEGSMLAGLRDRKQASRDAFA